MDSKPRLEIREQMIEVIRNSLTSNAPLIETLEWGEVDYVHITGLEDIEDDFRKDRPLGITIEAADLEVESFASEDDGIRNFEEALEDATGITYYGETNSVEFDKDKSNNKNFKEFVKFLFDHGFIKTDDLPEAMPNATKNFILNDTKATLGGDDVMDHANPIEIDGETIYYNPKDPKGQKKEHIQYLIKKYIEDEESQLIFSEV